MTWQRFLALGSDSQLPQWVSKHHLSSCICLPLSAARWSLSRILACWSLFLTLSMQWSFFRHVHPQDNYLSLMKHMTVPIHAHTNPCLVPPPVQSVLSSLPGPICSSTSFHVRIHSLLSLHKKLPPTQSSPYWVLISFNTGESSRLSPEVPFQYPFVSKRFESTNITQKKLHMEYFKPVSPISYRLSLSPASPFSAFSEPHLCGGKKPLSRHFGFSGTKNIVQLLLFFFFFSPEKWMAFGFVHESRQGQSDGHWSWSASLASSSGTRPEEPVDGSVLLYNLLHLCFLPTAPLEKDAAWGNEGFIASWIMLHMRKGDLKGNSYVRRPSEKSPGHPPLQCKHTGLLFPRFTFSSCAICVAENGHWVP